MNRLYPTDRTQHKAQNVSAFRYYVLRFVLCCLLVLAPSSLRAEAGAEAEGQYVVQPGDTLSAIAARFGTNTFVLVRLNNLRNARDIYPGQHLRLFASGRLDTRAWGEHRIAPGEDFFVLAHRAGLSWMHVAEANHMLNPTSVLPGQIVRFPPFQNAVVALEDAQVSRVVAALRHDVSYWRMIRLNPQPHYADRHLLVPGVSQALRLPYPLVSLDVMPQPVIRGTTTVLIARTSLPTSCEVLFLDRIERCYGEDEGMTHVALLGFSPLLDPGRYIVELRIVWGEEEVIYPVPVALGAGRYDYERVDLPSGRQSLLDPARTQAERTKIAALRELRSPERLWEFPFQMPVESSVTSYYGSRRSYGYGFGSFHAGTDFRAKTGTPILSPASGTVILAEPLVVRGNAILVDHGWGIVTGYWHLSKIEVTVGQMVTQGERIGAVGNTGFSNGPHLHWELWVNGTAVSPLQWVLPFAEFPE